MKIEAKRADSFARNPDSGLQAILVYGPDTGLVRHRVQELARSVVSDLADPFRLVETTADAIKDDPAKLSDEVAAIPFGGGRRALILRDAGDSLTNILADFLAHPPCLPPQAALVILEAGPLPPRSSLRDLCERAGNAAALACYADEGAQLSDFVRKRLLAERVAVSPEALRYLADNLGSDRMVTLRELEKLAIYAGAGGNVEIEDAIAVVGDSAALSMDEVAMAAAAGDMAALDRAVDRVFLEGSQPVAVLRAVSRHFERLRQAGAAIAAGSSDEAAMATLRPAVFFKQKPKFRAGLKRWPMPLAAAALSSLIETEILCKTTGMPAETVCRQALFELARQPARL